MATERITAPLVKGDRVWTWFDTGAMGQTPLIGKVESAGPKTAMIEWESGARNRLRWDLVFGLCYRYRGEWDK